MAVAGQQYFESNSASLAGDRLRRCGGTHSAHHAATQLTASVPASLIASTGQRTSSPEVTGNDAGN
jgi:hypothetical protein